MYRNVQSRVTVNGSFTDDALVQVGLHQGSVLIPLLFIIVVGVLSREIRLGCPGELLYADEAWKGAVGVKGLRVNVKTKMMISCKNAGKVTEEGGFPFTIYRKVVGSNSIFCQFCRRWVHKKCSVIRVKLKENSKFKC